MKLTFIGSKPVTANVISFVFQPVERIKWQPGQYMHYVLPHPDSDDRGTERWFTNSAAPFENKVMISTRIDREHGSSFKRALLMLQPGDGVEADGPEGEFTIDNETRNHIFVAGGIGITPFRSILMEAQNKGKKLHVDLLYANRDQDIPFKEELNRIAADNEYLKAEYIVSPDKLDAAIIKQRADNVDNPFVYLSGPEPMVKSLAAELEQLGVSKENIRVDDFPGYEGI